MSEVPETRAEAADLKRFDRAIPQWVTLAAAVSSMTAVLIGLAVFVSAQFLGQARLRQESSASQTAERAEQEKLRLEYIRVAVAILTAKPVESQRGMRKWAVDVLNRSTDVKLSDEQSRALIEGESVLYGNGYGTDAGYGNGYGTDYGYYFGEPCGPEPTATVKPNR